MRITPWLLAGAGVCIASLALAQDGAPLAKSGGYHLHTARFGATAVTDGTSIYVVGGSVSDGTRMDEVERFNPETGQSEVFAHLKTGRRFAGAVADGGKIYVIGGDSLVHGQKDEFFTDTVEVIDLASGSVSAAAPMPVKKAQFGCVAVDGKIYAAGGMKARGSTITITNDTEVYDIAADKWSHGVPMPTGRLCGATSVTGFVIVPGGYGSHRELTNVEMFSPKEKLWRVLPKLHKGVSSYSLAFFGHHFFIFTQTELVAYDLKAKQSRSYDVGYKAVRDTAAVVLNDKLYVIGGVVSYHDPMMDYFPVKNDDPSIFAKGEALSKVVPDVAVDDIQVFALTGN